MPVNEQELKFIIPKDNNVWLEDIVDYFRNNGFLVKSFTYEENNDIYFDDEDLSLYKNKDSLRIRKSVSKDNTNIFGTFKKLNEKETKFLGRTVYQRQLNTDDYMIFMGAMAEEQIPLYLSNISPKSLLNAQTFRKKVVFEFDGGLVSLCLDDAMYTSYAEHDNIFFDKTLEVKSNDRVILDLAARLLSEEYKELMPSNQSKYERGLQGVITHLDTYEDKLVRK